MTLPGTPTEISADWLNTNVSSAAFGGHSVTAVSHEDIGEGTGIFGQIARLNLTLDDGSHNSVVVKMPCTEPANLAVAQMLGIYEREIAMYEHVVPDSSLNAPNCLHAVQLEDQSFVLVIEDMAQEWHVGDQIVGATLPQAEAIVDALARFHVEWWEHDDLASLDWLPRPDAPQYVAAVPGIYAAGLEGLQSEWADRVAATGIEVALELAPKFEDVLLRTAQGPTTLIHTDTRLDNIMFAADGSGEVAFIDFQLALAGRGVADIAYLVMTSVPAEISEQHWEALLRRWHQAITASGIDYSWDDCLSHYREAALYYLSGSMSLIGTMDAGNERGAAMAEAYVTRSFAHVVDCDARSVL